MQKISSSTISSSGWALPGPAGGAYSAHSDPLAGLIFPGVIPPDPIKRITIKSKCYAFVFMISILE